MSVADILDIILIFLSVVTYYFQLFVFIAGGSRLAREGMPLQRTQRVPCYFLCSLLGLLNFVHGASNFSKIWSASGQNDVTIQN